VGCGSDVEVFGEDSEPNHAKVVMIVGEECGIETEMEMVDGVKFEVEEEMLQEVMQSA
jgi:hypothetical protein